MRRRILTMILLGSMVFVMSACQNYNSTASEWAAISGDAVSGTVVSGQAILEEETETKGLEKGSKDIGYSAFKNGNSTNCYADYFYEEDEEKEYDASTDILQFDRNKKVSASIDTGIDDFYEIIKVTEKAIYCRGYDKTEKESIYRIPIQKTRDNDIVLVDKKEEMTVEAKGNSRYVTYLDDDCVVYQVCDESDDEADITNIQWYRYDWRTEETEEIQGAPDSCRSYQRVSDTELVCYGVLQEDSYEELFLYYDAEKNTVRRADLGEFFYNYKTSFIRQVGKTLYFYTGEVFGVAYEGIPTLKRYDMETGRLEDAITKKEWVTFLKKQNRWKSGLTVYVREIVEGEGRLWLGVSLIKCDKKKVRHWNHIVVSCSEVGEFDLRYETKINNRIRDKGDKKVFTDRYGVTHRDEDALPCLDCYPYVLAMGVKEEVYHIKTGEKIKIIGEKQSDFGCQISEFNF